MAANFNHQLVFLSGSISAGNDDYTMLRAATVNDAFGVARGNAAGTVTVQKGAAAITGALNINGGITTLTRATTIAHANASLAVSDTLRVVKNNAVSSWTFARLTSTGSVT